MAGSERHRTGLERFIKPKLTETENEKTSFQTPDMVEEALRDLVPSVKALERVLRCYQVKSTSGIPHSIIADQ